MAECSYQGAILAAGHGSRMGPFGDKVPKPIVPICNQPLLMYQIEALKGLGITEIFMVIGHLGHRIVQLLGDGSAHGVRIRYVEQLQRLGLAHAVRQLEPFVDRPFILMLGDMFYEFRELQGLLDTFEKEEAAAVLAVKEESDAEEIRRNYTILLREDGTARRVIEKPRHATTNLRGCGLYLFDLPVFDAIRRTPRTAMRDEYELTDSIQILIDYDFPVRVAHVIEWDTNITLIGDLIRCCRRELRRRGENSLVGEGCTIAGGVTLNETVVGDRVTITKPVCLERCVVLSDVILDDGLSYKDTVITPEHKLPGMSRN